MPLTLSPELDTQLAVVAAQRGLPPENTLAQLLSEAVADFHDAFDGIRRGMADGDAGREITLDDYRFQLAPLLHPLTVIRRAGLGDGVT